MKCYIVLAIALCAVFCLSDVEAYKPYKKCAQACPFLHQPVCADVGYGAKRTFGNKCVMEQEACQTGKQYRFIKYGSCEPPPPPAYKPPPPAYQPPPPAYKPPAYQPPPYQPPPPKQPPRKYY